MANFFGYVGGLTFRTIGHVYNVFGLLLETLYWILIGPFIKKGLNRKNLFDQMVFTGIKSLIIVCFVSIFTGVVLAMQSAYQLQKLGAVMYVSSLVSISMARELGPVLVALVVAGRVGAAITAEIGTMKVTEQIEALQTLALNPVRFLVVPRFLALLVMLPCLTVLGDIVGMIGGYLVGVLNLHISPGLYIDVTLKFLKLKDVYTGLMKSVVFSMIISLIGSYEGLNTSGGAEGVGKYTTVSVVTSFILIILADCVLTAIFYFSQM